MKRNLQSKFSTRQHMVSEDFEIYYYNDTSLEKVAAHAHDYYEFYFFLEGDISIQIGSSMHSVKYGDIMVIPPHVYHRPVIHSIEKPYRRFVFWITADYCKHLEELSADYAYLIHYIEKTGNYLFHNDQITFNSIYSKLLRLVEEIHADHFGRDAQISLYVNDLILYLNRLIYERSNPREQREELPLYQNICEFIEHHLDEDLSLERLSAEFYMSKYHISHIFKNNLGLSVHQYITKKRLSLCRKAIIGGASITETYQSYGFGDYSSFFRAFKKEYGVSPKEYQDMQLLLTRDEIVDSHENC